MTYNTAQNNTTDLYSKMGLAKQSNFPLIFRENTVKIWVHGLLPLKDINIKKTARTPLRQDCLLVMYLQPLLQLQAFG